MKKQNKIIPFMRGERETKNNFQVWNFREKKDDTKECAVRREKYFETENEEFNCGSIDAEVLTEYPKQMSGRQMQELEKTIFFCLLL